MKEFDYWDGKRWMIITEEWLSGVNLKNLRQVRLAGRDEIECVYWGKNGTYSIFYQKCGEVWGFPYTVSC